MNNPCLLGIDIGTSGAKVVLVDKRGRLLAWAGQEYPIQTPQPGWAEQDPEAWLAAATRCVNKVVQQSEINPAQIACIGLGGQMHSLVCVDRQGKPVRPAILWADQRSAAQVQRITHQIGQDQLAQWTGNPLAAGFMLASLAWLAENEPAVLQDTRWYLLPKDYVRFRMTGQIGAEHSDASSTLLYDPHRREWSAPLLRETGVPAECLPELHESQAVAGPLAAAFADAWGLPQGVPLVYGGSDVSLQALAQGIVEPGTVSCTIGTGGQLFAPLGQPRHDPALRLHLFCHAVPNLWHQEAAILTAGLALRWLRDQFWPGASYDELAGLAAGVEAGLQGIYFLPYLAGERTPHMDASLRASLHGLALHHGQAHIIRAVMEGVVFALRQGIERMQALGTPVERLVATGGAVRHPLWLRLQADIFGRPIFTAPVEDAAGSATARGAAILAAVGAGLYSDLPAALYSMASTPVQAAVPDPDRAARYAAAFAEYARRADLAADHKI